MSIHRYSDETVTAPQDHSAGGVTLVPYLRFGRGLKGGHEDLYYICLHSAREKTTYIASYRVWEKAIVLVCPVM